jgi:high-affinity nickel-transport protein
MDSIDGSFMNFAYGWALSEPVRKVVYNLTITGLSVAVALVIGTIELGGLISSELDLSGSFGAGSRTSTSTSSGSWSSPCLSLRG